MRNARWESEAVIYCMSTRDKEENKEHWSQCHTYAAQNVLITLKLHPARTSETEKPLTQSCLRGSKCLWAFASAIKS